MRPKTMWLLAAAALAVACSGDREELDLEGDDPGFPPGKSRGSGNHNTGGGAATTTVTSGVGGSGGTGFGGGEPAAPLYPFCGCIDSAIQDQACGDCFVQDLEICGCLSGSTCELIVNRMLTCPGANKSCFDNSAGFATPDEIAQTAAALDCLCSSCACADAACP